MTIEQAHVRDLPQIHELLSRHHLPLAGLDEHVESRRRLKDSFPGFWKQESPSLQNPPAAGTASTSDTRDAFRVVVVRQLFASVDAARRENPDRGADDVDVAIRMAGVIDVARDIAADRGVTRRALVDVEDPDARTRQVPSFAAPPFGL
jgi:hypothetical protein